MTLRVCRHLRRRDFQIQHILSDGSLEAHGALEERMLKVLGKSQPSLFVSRQEIVEEAYEEQGGRIAYRQSPESADDELRTAGIS